MWGARLKGNQAHSEEIFFAGSLRRRLLGRGVGGKVEQAQALRKKTPREDRKK